MPSAALQSSMVSSMRLTSALELEGPVFKIYLVELSNGLEFRSSIVRAHYHYRWFLKKVFWTIGPGWPRFGGIDFVYCPWCMKILTIHVVNEKQGKPRAVLSTMEFRLSSGGGPAPTTAPITPGVPDIVLLDVFLRKGFFGRASYMYSTIFMPSKKPMSYLYQRNVTTM